MIWIATILVCAYGLALIAGRFARPGLTKTVKRWWRKTELIGNIISVEETEHAVAVDIRTAADTDTIRAHVAALGEQTGMHSPDIETRHGGALLLMLPKEVGVSQLAALRKPWTNTTPTGRVDLKRLPVARDAYGKMWELRAHGSHVLVIGATGSGKGSVIWAIAGQVAPNVADGSAQLWGVDPKGGVELGLGRDMFSRFVYGGVDDWPTEIATLLADARELMDARLSRMMSQRVRDHKPTPDEPLIILIIDEFLTLTLGVADRDVQKDIVMDLTMILSKGRAAGVCVVACAQLAQKEALSASIRDLFPVRVGLRMTDRLQVDMAMGAAARDRGAECHLIPPDMPGCAYVLTDAREARLVRFPWSSDEAVERLARGHRPPRRVAPSRVIEAPTEPLVELRNWEAPSPVQEVVEPVEPVETAAEKVRELLTAHPDWTQKRTAQEAGVSDRYVRKVRDEIRTEASK